MSTVIGPNFRILHIPKTGGTWVQDVVTRWLDIPHVVDHRFGGHAIYNNALGKGLPTFVVVRNPYTWYESYYKEGTQMRWAMSEDNPGLAIRQCGSKTATFRQFFLEVMRKFPSWYLNFIDEFTFFKTGPNPLLTVGKYETMGEDLIKFLDSVGTTYDKEVVRDRTNFEVNKSKPMSLVWDEEMKNLMAKNHKEVFDAFGYDL